MIALLAVVGVCCLVVGACGHMNDHNNRYPLPLGLIAIGCFATLLLMGVH